MVIRCGDNLPKELFSPV